MQLIRVIKHIQYRRPTITGGTQLGLSAEPLLDQYLVIEGIRSTDPQIDIIFQLTNHRQPLHMHNANPHGRLHMRSTTLQTHAEEYR
jgi:hypothetical protein